MFNEGSPSVVWLTYNLIIEGKIIMSEKGLNYAQLKNDEARENALQNFIAFYIDQYRHNSLEIISAKASNQVMSTINEILHQNLYRPHDELLETSERLSKAAYEEILNELSNLQFDQDGEPLVPFETIWQTEEEQLPSED